MKITEDYMRKIRRALKNRWQRRISILLVTALMLSAVTPTFASASEGTESVIEYAAQNEGDVPDDPVQEKTPEAEADSDQNKVNEQKEATSNDYELKETSDEAVAAEHGSRKDAMTSDVQTTERNVSDTKEVKTGDLVLEDSSFGVRVTVPESSLPNGVSGDKLALRVRDLTSGERSAFMKTVGVSENLIVWLYDISLVNTDTGEEMQPSGPVTVTVSEGMPKESSVYRMDDEGGFTEMSAEVEGDETSFETEHFTPYGGVNFLGSLQLTGQTWGLAQLMIAYQEEGKLYTGFCIEINKSFRGDNEYKIYYNLSAEEFNEYAESVTLSEEDFMKLKRMMYLYETTYKENGGNFSLDCYYGNRRQIVTISDYSNSAEYINLKHWVLFQCILHSCLESGVSQNSILNGRRRTESRQDNSSSIRQAYYNAAMDSGKDDEINRKYDFLVAQKNDNQNVIIIKEKDSYISTTVNVEGKYSNSRIALPLSVEDLHKSASYDGMVEVTVNDTVHYYDFEEDRYNIEGYLYQVQADGTVDESSPVATASRTNVALSGNGSIVMDFGTIPLKPNARYVVYETVSTVNATPQKIYQHKQSDDNTQSFTISEIKTTLAAGDNNSAHPVIAKPEDAAGGIALVDTIRYENLPLASYQIKAELYEVVWNKTEKTYEVSGNPVAVKNLDSYTISQKDGTIPVDFGTVKNLEEGKRYVAYQTMTSKENLIDTDGDSVADAKHVIRHMDPNDEAETLVIKVPDETKFRVAKAWDPELAGQEEPVTVRLYDNGSPAEIDGVETQITLSAENQWTYEWTNLPNEGHKYTAVEVLDGDEGYRPTYEAEQDFTYTKKTTTTPDPVDTTKTITETKWVKYTGSTFNNGDELILVNPNGDAMTLSSGSSSNFESPSWNGGLRRNSDGSANESSITNYMVWTVQNYNNGSFNLVSKARTNRAINTNGQIYVGAENKKTAFTLNNGYLRVSGGSYNGYYAYCHSNGMMLRDRSQATQFTVYKKSIVTTEVPGDPIIPDPVITTEEITEKVYLITNKPVSGTGDMKLVKVDSEDTSMVLSGAAFDLYQVDDEASAMIPYTQVRGTRLEDYSGRMTDTNGVLEFKGLAYGDYYLVETAAPERYKRGEVAIKLTLNADGFSVEGSAGGAMVTDNTIKTIESSGSITGDPGSWSLCLNGRRTHPGYTSSTSKGEYITHSGVSYNEMYDFIDTKENPHGTATVKESFSEDDYRGIKRVLYWYLTYGQHMQNPGNALTAAQRVLRIYTDGSDLSQSGAEYLSCHNFVVNNTILVDGKWVDSGVTDEEIQNQVQIIVYENQESSTLNKLQNMVSGVLTDGNDTAQHVDGVLQVKNTKEETHLKAPETGGLGLNNLYRMSWFLLAVGLCMLLMKRYSIAKK